jgi:hypothetical protein
MATQTHEFNFPLGAKAKDIVTGFSGTIVGRIQYLTGCDQYLLQPLIGKDGKIPGHEQFDENRIQLVGRTVLKLGVLPKKEVGGPQVRVNKY